MFLTRMAAVPSKSFVITIIPWVINNLHVVVYITKFKFGNYYTEAAGRGTLIPFGTKSTIQRRYMYAKTTTILIVLIICFLR
jgi:hypothetical protein